MGWNLKIIVLQHLLRACGNCVGCPIVIVILITRARMHTYTHPKAFKCLKGGFVIILGDRLNPLTKAGTSLYN